MTKRRTRHSARRAGRFASFLPPLPCCCSCPLPPPLPFVGTEALQRAQPVTQDRISIGAHTTHVSAPRTALMAFCIVSAFISRINLHWRCDKIKPGQTLSSWFCHPPWFPGGSVAPHLLPRLHRATGGRAASCPGPAGFSLPFFFAFFLAFRA